MSIASEIQNGDDDLGAEYDAWLEEPANAAPAGEEPDAPPPEGLVPLGHSRGVFYYYSLAGKQIRGLQDSQHSKNTLTALASVAHYWQRTKFANAKSGNIDWDEAIDWLMTECKRLGIYDPAKIRGRGAWIDDGRAVLHVGDCLIVDGQRAPLNLPDSRYVYEAAIRLGAFRDSPLATREANRLMELCRRLSWGRGISGTLMAGFIVVAPICGGLVWRPSCWMTGASDSGKSWINHHIIHPMLAGVSLFVQGKTTEPGLRQALGSDALPVLFDEAEGEERNAEDRIQGILSLVRQASSESAGVIVKGTQNQTSAKMYRIRSSFWFSSINVGIVHRADESRITVLSVGGKKLTKEEFASLERDTPALITEKYAAALVARSVRLLPVIRANAATFKAALDVHLGSNRVGDQIGTLLAGAYSLHSIYEITPAQALDYVQRQEWDAVAPPAALVETDEQKLLTRLTQTKIRINGGQEPTLERLIRAAWGLEDAWLTADVAEREIRAIGVRSDPAGIWVSNTHPNLARLLAGTPWSASWARTLERVPGSEPSPRTVRFGSMSPSRAVFLPRETLERPD